MEHICMSNKLRVLSAFSRVSIKVVQMGRDEKVTCR